MSTFANENKHSSQSINCLDLLDPKDDPFPMSCLELRPFEEHEAMESQVQVLENRKSGRNRPNNTINSKNSSKNGVRRLRRSIHPIKVHVSEEQKELSIQLAKLSLLGQNCKLLQKIILSNSSSELFKPGVGFNSDEQEQVCYKEVKRRKVSEYKIEDEEQQIYYESSRLQNGSKQFEWNQKKSVEEISQSNYNLLTEIHTTLQNIQDNNEDMKALAEFFNCAINNRVFNVTEEDKKLYVQFRNEYNNLQLLLSENEKIISEKNDEHYCKLCGIWFENGRQLGGHMSRKHPGRSEEYGIKKGVHFIKKVERTRRNYFKNKDQTPGSSEFIK